MNKDVYFEVPNDIAYTNKQPRIILDSGTCFGFKYYIITFGTHPCSYIEIPKNHKLYYKDYMDIEEEIEVHGGLTYSKNYLMGVDESGLHWYIGWDYGHAFDYQIYGRVDGKLLESKGHKWTIDELKEEVFDVCKQLEKMY